MRNIVAMTAVAALVLASVVTTAQDDDKDYFTAGVVGDNYVICGANVDGTVEGATGVDPNTGLIDFEQEFGFCLGGNTFVDLEEGDYSISAQDELALAGPSGAYRVEDGEGGVVIDNVDECFDQPLSTAEPVPEGGSILVWIDGVVWWAQGQPCGVGQTSQGTVGTISIRLL